MCYCGYQYCYQVPWIYKQPSWPSAARMAYDRQRSVAEHTTGCYEVAGQDVNCDAFYANEGGKIVSKLKLTTEQEEGTTSETQKRGDTSGFWIPNHPQINHNNTREANCNQEECDCIIDRKTMIPNVLKPSRTLRAFEISEHRERNYENVVMETKYNKKESDCNIDKTAVPNSLKHPLHGFGIYERNYENDRETNYQNDSLSGSVDNNTAATTNVKTLCCTNMEDMDKFSVRGRKRKCLSCQNCRSVNMKRVCNEGNKSADKNCITQIASLTTNVLYVDQNEHGPSTHAKSSTLKTSPLNKNAGCEFAVNTAFCNRKVHKSHNTEQSSTTDVCRVNLNEPRSNTHTTRLVTTTTSSQRNTGNELSFDAVSYNREIHKTNHHLKQTLTRDVLDVKDLNEPQPNTRLNTPNITLSQESVGNELSFGAASYNREKHRTSHKLMKSSAKEVLQDANQNKPSSNMRNSYNDRLNAPETYLQQNVKKNKLTQSTRDFLQVNQNESQPNTQHNVFNTKTASQQNIGNKFISLDSTKSAFLTLMSHVSQQSDDVTISCPYCQHSFTKYCDLKIHVRTHMVVPTSAGEHETEAQAQFLTCTEAMGGNSDKNRGSDAPGYKSTQGEVSGDKSRATSVIKFVGQKDALG